MTLSSQSDLENRISVQLGKMLQSARSYRRLNAEAVYHHLCSKTAYYDVEHCVKIPDALMFCALMERAGLSAQRFYIIVSPAEAEFFALKKTSGKAVIRDDRQKLRECLEQISSMKEPVSSVKDQWEQYLTYALLIREEGHTKKAYEAIQRAAESTIGDLFELNPQKKLLGGEEIQFLLMFLAETFEQKKKNMDEAGELLRKVRDYIKNGIWDDDEKAILMSREAALETVYFHELGQNLGRNVQENTIAIVRDAVIAMRYNRTLCDMPRLLSFLADHEESGEDRERYAKQGAVLGALMEEFGRNCAYQAEKIFFVQPLMVQTGEFLRIGRKEKKYSQRTVSEEICSEHNYSRIESGKREPHRKSLEKILDRLELGWGYYSGEIASDEIRCHMVRIKIKLAISHESYEMASRLLAALENMLDLSIPQNRQYVELTHVILDKRLGKRGQNLIDRLQEILGYSNASLETERFYSPIELDILYYMEIVFRYNLRDPRSAERIANICIQNEHQKSFSDEFTIMYHERLLAGVYSDLQEWEKEEKIAEKWLFHIFDGELSVDLLEQFLDLYSEALRMQGKEENRARKMLASAVYMAELYNMKNASPLKYGYEQTYGAKNWYDLNV